jgi:hypothetical protein
LVEIVIEVDVCPCRHKALSARRKMRESRFIDNTVIYIGGIGRRL